MLGAQGCFGSRLKLWPQAVIRGLRILGVCSMQILLPDVEP
jgi:hypothetical protein